MKYTSTQHYVMTSSCLLLFLVLDQTASYMPSLSFNQCGSFKPTFASHRTLTTRKQPQEPVGLLAFSRRNPVQPQHALLAMVNGDENDKVDFDEDDDQGEWADDEDYDDEDEDEDDKDKDKVKGEYDDDEDDSKPVSDEDLFEGVFEDEEELEEEEYEYVEVTESQETVEIQAKFDEDDGDDGDYELQTEDPNDPNYQRQWEAVQDSIKKRKQQKQDEEFDALDYIQNKMTNEEAEMFDQSEFMKMVEERSKNMVLTEEDVKGIDLEADVEAVSDLMDDDPYPVHQEGEENMLEKETGITDQDMVELDDAWKAMKEAQSLEPFDKVNFKADHFDWDSLSNETMEDLDNCLNEIGGAAYNCTRWLLYDLDFNVTNLMLAAVKHNRNAPLLMQHWYPQLLTYKRYQYVRDRNFDWNWGDVENSDVTELERYYRGFGYDEIPKKAPGETGIISMEELDEEEIKMAAFEKWMSDVYNAEWDKKDFDDDSFRDEDNVFSPYFEYPDHPDLPKFEDTQEDLAEWAEEMNSTDPEMMEYRDHLGRNVEYKLEEDEAFRKEFRGHLVVACTPEDSDLEIAEKITKRMSEEHGKQVFVETRVMAHAREEDNVFEVWLESYEIDLLHSKRRASLGTKGWNGRAECDDEQVEYLVKEVGFLISDDSRYSYRFHDEAFEGSY